jgi:ABC-2 type transport system permease protein
MSTTRPLDIPSTISEVHPTSDDFATSTVQDAGAAQHSKNTRTAARQPLTVSRSGAGTVRAVLRVVHAETVKLLGLRSTVIALAVTAFFVSGLGAVMTAGVAFEALGAADQAGAPPVAALDAPVGGINTAFFAIAALGVLAVSAEYSTRTIRSTLAAVPHRAVLVAGKALAVAAVTFVVALPSTLVVHVAGRLMLTAGGVPTDLPPADTARVVIGAALYLVAVALVGSGFAWLLRSTAGALTATVLLLIVSPALAMLLPQSIGERIRPFLPDVGAAVFESVPTTHPWAALGVLAAYGVALLTIAAVRINRRDS